MRNALTLKLFLALCAGALAGAFTCALAGAAAPALAVSPAAAPSTAASLFCTRPATTLKYERREAATATLWWTHTESIDVVHANADGSLSLDVTSVIVSDIGKSPLKAPVHSVVKVHANGTVEVDAAEAAKQAAENMFSALDFKSSGGSSLLPADIKPGDTLPEIHAAVTWAIVSLTIDYTARKVLRRETITVPAGTFDCIVVQESKSERAPFHRRDRVTLTWYAPGYGMIRHDTLLTDLTPETSEVLVEIIK